MGEKNIAELTAFSIDKLHNIFTGLELTETQLLIGEQILKEIKARIQFLLDVGLDYLTLARATGTLSGGEAQRIRLATQIGSGLVGVAYILDEPSIGSASAGQRQVTCHIEASPRFGKFSDCSGA